MQSGQQYQRTCRIAQLDLGECRLLGQHIVGTGAIAGAGSGDRCRQEFVAVIDDAMAALDANGIESATRNEVLGILWSLKGEVVRQ